MIEEMGIYERDSNYFILVTGRDEKEGTKTVFAIYDTFGNDLILEEEFYDINDYTKVSDNTLCADIALGIYETDTKELNEAKDPCDNVIITCGLLTKGNTYIKVFAVIAPDGIHMMDIHTGKPVKRQNGWSAVIFGTQEPVPVGVALEMVDNCVWEMISDFQKRKED